MKEHVRGLMYTRFPVPVPERDRRRRRSTEGSRHPSAPRPPNVRSSQLTGSTLRHVFLAAAASVPPESTAIPLRLLSPSTHPCSPRRLHRRQVLPPPHLRQRDPAEERGLLHRRRERAVGLGVQVLADGEGELRAALPLAGVLRPHIRRRSTRGRGVGLCSRPGVQVLYAQIIPWRKLGWCEGILQLLMKE